MRLNILMCVFFFGACDAVSAASSGSKPEKDVSDQTTVVSNNQSGGVTAKDVQENKEDISSTKDPSKIEAIELKGLTQQEVFELADFNDTTELLAAEYRKAFRKWMSNSKETRALKDTMDKRFKMIDRLAKERQRKPECLLVVAGKNVDDVENLAKKCGSAGWAIEASGRVVGGK